MAEFKPDQKKKERVSTEDLSQKGKEAQQTDHDFFSASSRFFAEKQKTSEDNAASESDDLKKEGDLDVADRMREQRAIIGKIAYPREVERMRSSDAAPALSTLLDSMLRNERNLREADPEDTEAQRLFESSRKTARDLFIKSGEKLFRGIHVTAEDFSEINGEARRFTSADGTYSPTEEVSDPQIMLNSVQHGLDSISSYLEGISPDAYNAGQKGNLEEQDKILEQMATGAKIAYKLELLRNKLEQHIKKSAETQKIDTLRTELKGKEQTLSPEGVKLLEKLAQAVYKENMEVEQSTKERKVRARQYKLASDAFRSIWLNDSALAQRFSELSKKVDEQEQKLLKSGKDPVLSRNKAFYEVYEQDLSPDERQALEDESFKDTERQEEISRRLGGITGFGRIPAPRIFEMMMRELKK